VIASACAVASVTPKTVTVVRATAVRIAARYPRLREVPRGMLVGRCAFFMRITRAALGVLGAQRQ